jgi:hypothetical protein
MTTVELSPGGHEIELRVMDSAGNTAEDAVFITVAEASLTPWVIIAFPGPGDIGFEGVTYEFLANVGDGQDLPEALSVTFATDLEEGEFCTAQPQVTGLVACAAELSPGVHALTFTVTDSTGLSGSDAADFVVQAEGDDDDDTQPPDDDDAHSRPTTTHSRRTTTATATPATWTATTPTAASTRVPPRSPTTALTRIAAAPIR